MYNYKQIDMVYDIKKKFLHSGYWDSAYTNYFPDFHFSDEGRYAWIGEVNDESIKDEDVLSNVSTTYDNDKESLLDFLTSTQYKFLLDNLELFHAVYRIGDNLVISLV